jgi:L-lactate utilization protein LutB
MSGFVPWFEQCLKCGDKCMRNCPLFDRVKISEVTSKAEFGETGERISAEVLLEMKVKF